MGLYELIASHCYGLGLYRFIIAGGMKYYNYCYVSYVWDDDFYGYIQHEAAAAETVQGT